MCQTGQLDRYLVPILLPDGAFDSEMGLSDRMCELHRGSIAVAPRPEGGVVNFLNFFFLIRLMPKASRFSTCAVHKLYHDWKL